MQPEKYTKKSVQVKSSIKNTNIQNVNETSQKTNLEIITPILQNKRNTNKIKEEFIKKANKEHNNKYDYSLVEYVNAGSKVKIICPKPNHGVFEQTPGAHVRPQNCPSCDLDRKQNLFSIEKFIEQSKQTHGETKYDYSVTTHKDENNKVSILCPKHGIFSITVNKHIQCKQGCKKCGKLSAKQKRSFTQETFEEKARKAHGDKYDFSQCKYVNATTKVTLYCDIHKSSFEILPGKLYDGCACKLCGYAETANKLKFTTEHFIKESRIKHGDKYDYSRSVYVNGASNVIIGCPEHSFFEQRADSHMKGAGCFKCGIIVRADTQRGVAQRSYTKKWDTPKFILHAKEKHGDKYTYHDTIYVNHQSYVTITCKEHQNFNQIAKTHLNGGICPTCANIANSNRQIFDIEKFIEICNVTHNNKYDYSETTFTDPNEYITIRCPDHGLFSIPRYSHMYGHGCKLCGNLSKKNKLTKTTETFIVDCKRIHDDKFDYSKVNYVDAKTPVTIICNFHNDFFIRPKIFLSNKHGCNKCAAILGPINNRSTKEHYVELARKKYGDLYDYTDTVYVDLNTEITIGCREHGPYKRTAEGHLCGRTCPKCIACPKCFLWRTYGKLCSYCKPKNENKLFQKTKEMKIVNFLKASIPNKQFIHNKSVGGRFSGGHLFPDIRFDCGKYHLIVEIDEDQHRHKYYNCETKRMNDIIADLQIACIFIRYNPDSKESDPNVLLDKVNEYLNLNFENKTHKDHGFDEFGLKVEYLFYK